MTKTISQPPAVALLTHLHTRSLEISPLRSAAPAALPRNCASFQKPMRLPLSGTAERGARREGIYSLSDLLE